MDTYFMLTGAGGYPAPAGFIDGTISYAGGSAALVGKNIGISHILDNLAGASGPELVCDNCTLTFSTGPFAGTVPHEGTPDGYSFSGGGSLQIIGGFRSQDGSVTLPANTVLLKAVPTGASTLIENGPLPVLPEVMLEFKQVVLHPKLRSLFSFPAGDFTGQLLIASADTAKLNTPPDPFVLSKFVGTHFFEPSYVLVMTDANQAVSLQKG